jgi:hypothetical protein
MDDPEEDLISISAEPKKVEVKSVVFFKKKCVIVGGDFVVSHVITILESLRDKIIFIKNNNIENRSVYQVGA